MTTTPTQKSDELAAILHAASETQRRLEFAFRQHVLGDAGTSRTDVCAMLALASATIGGLIDVIEDATATMDASPVEAPAAPAAAPPAAGKRCRHEWIEGTVPPRCAVCGETKKAQGRRSTKPDAAPAAVVVTIGDTSAAKYDPPTRPLPLGEDAANRYNAGGVGGPGVRK